MTRPLQFDLAEVTRFGDAQDQLGGEVMSACEPEVAVLAAEGAYGAAGAVLTVAVQAYLARLQTSGEQLATRYAEHGASIRAAVQQLANRDRDNAEQIPRPR